MDAVKAAIVKAMKDLYRRSVFFLGDLRSLDGFPWFTYAVRKHEVDYDEVTKALMVIQPGDIGLHRDHGYLSNVAIPGCFKHAWVHIDDGDIVEAISEGVVRRNAIYPIYSDMSIILRSKNKDGYVTSQRAQSLIGENYDVNFEFDIEKSNAHFYGNKDSKYDPAFSCTEVAAFSLYREDEGHGISSSYVSGKKVLIADSFINEDMEIVWASESVTLENVMKLGLGPSSVRLLSEYLNKKY